MNPHTLYLGQVLWYWGVYQFRGPFVAQDSLGGGQKALGPTMAVLGVGSVDLYQPELHIARQPEVKSSGADALQKKFHLGQALPGCVDDSAIGSWPNSKDDHSNPPLYA